MIKTKINGMAGFLVLAMFALSIFITPVSATIGGQKFPNVNWEDNIVTSEEIEIAQSTFSEPGILPDSPLYFFKRFAEDFELAFTFDKEKKEKLHIERAKKRMAETQKMVEDNRPEIAKDTANEFAKELTGIKDSNNAEISRESDEVTRKGIIVLEIVSEKVPNLTRSAFQTAINRSINHTEIRKRVKRDVACAQVMTYAMNLQTGEGRAFPTPCDVPEGWVVQVADYANIPDPASCKNITTEARSPEGELKFFYSQCDVPEGWLILSTEVPRSDDMNDITIRPAEYRDPSLLYPNPKNSTDGAPILPRIDEPKPFETEFREPFPEI